MKLKRNEVRQNSKFIFFYRNNISLFLGEAYKLALEEHNELIQQLTAKNRHIKEIIDQMRNIIWEINTMLAMR